jgi:hypothetical protein
MEGSHFGVIFTVDTCCDVANPFLLENSTLLNSVGSELENWCNYGNWAKLVTFIKVATLSLLIILPNIWS